MNKEQRITGNITPPNKDLEALKKHFPQCFDKSGNLDFEKFKKQLSKTEINFSKESYGMDWLGKSYARLLATDETTTLLKEDETFNQKLENANSENLLIKGDNLEVLKHLSNAYYEKIKMIYIDPPYNTGSDGFVYADDRKFTKDQLQELAGISEERAKRILDFTQSKSNSHSAWLTFMYPRLYIAKQLLKEDGVIFVSIDDNEVAQLKLLLDEVFGEENFVDIFSWNKTSTPASLSKKSRKTVEYILCYEKNKNNYKYYGEDLSGRDQPLLNEGNNIGVLEIPKEKIVFKIDDGIYPSQQYHRIKLLNDIEIIDGKCSVDLKIEGRFKWQQSFLNNEIEKGTTFIIKSNKFSIRFQRFEDESYKPPTNSIRDNIIFPLLDKTNVNIDTNETSSKELQELFGCKVFDFPKPVSLIKYLTNFIVKENDLILDFFAGSGTTADAVMQLNAEDRAKGQAGGGNRKFILVQLPEKIDPKKNKTAYDFVKQLQEERRIIINDKLLMVNEDKKQTKQELIINHSSLTINQEPTIFEITKERLIRASKKTQEETKEKIMNYELEIKNLKKEIQLEETKDKIQNLKLNIQNLLSQDLGFKIFETMPIWEDYNFEADELDEQQMLLFDESKLTKEDIKALLITWKTYDGVPLTESLQEINLGETQINNSPLTINNYTAHYSNGKLYLMNKGFKTKNLKTLLEKIDSDKDFNPTTIIAFGYHFESKNLREISENMKSYANKKNIDIDFITRY